MHCDEVIDSRFKRFAIPTALAFCLCFYMPKARAQVSSTTTADSPIVTVNFATTSATSLNPSFNGFNSNLLNAVEYYDTNYQHILATLSPSWLRFPGGTDSEAFSWASGQLVQTWVDGLSAKAYTQNINANALPIVAGKGGSSFSDFAALAANLGGAKIIVSVNAYTDSPESAQAFAQYALTNHIPVAAWELANEPYTWTTTDDPGTPGFFPDAHYYAMKMKSYRDAIKAADPNAVVTLYFSEAGHPDKLWDNTLANYTPQYWDAVSYHEYVFPGNLIAFDDLMAAANGQLVSNTTSYLTGYLMPKNAPGMRYVISEVSPASGQGGLLLGTLYGGIYSAEFSLRMSTLPQVMHVASFQVLSNAGIDETNRHLNVVQDAFNKGTTTNTTGLNFGFFVSAQAAGEAVANAALHNSIGVYTTTTAGGPTAPILGGGTIPAIYAQAYDGGNGKRYVVLTNKSIFTAVAQIMQDGAGLTSPMQMTFVTGTDPTLPNFGTVPDNVPIQTQTVTDPGAVTIPPYSVVRLEWSVSPCNYTMSFGGQVLPASGGSGTINFIAPANCPWTVGPLPAWITVTGASSGMGTGTITFNVLPNNSGDLSASITIGGTPFTVEQQAASIPGLSLIGSMPHIAAEENWTTTFTLVNKSNATATARLSLFGDPGDTTGNGPLSLPLAFPQISPAPAAEMAASLDRTIPSNASLIIDSSGPQTPPVQVGSAQLAATAAVDGFAIFHLIPEAQEAVVPMETRNANSYLLAFDNTAGVVLGVAVENVSAQPTVIPIMIRDDTGAVIGSAGATISLARNGHTSFVLSSQYPVTANKRGTIEFDTPVGGRISVLGLRFTPPNNALTTIPALANVVAGGGSIAHLASGGDGWQTTFVLINTGTSSAQATLSFYADQTGAPMLLPLTFPQGNIPPTTAPSLTHTLAAGATLLVVSSGEAQLLIGSAQLSTSGQVSGFVIYRHNNQEAVVPLESRNANAYILAFDNTNGTATGIAVNAVSTQGVSVPVIVRDDTGAQIAIDTLNLAANGHTQFTLVTDKYPATANIRGTIEFDKPANGQIGAVGIRIPAGAAHTYTTLPALAR
jgi:hypothetical protein